MRKIKFCVVFSVYHEKSRNAINNYYYEWRDPLFLFFALVHKDDIRIRKEFARRRQFAGSSSVLVHVVMMGSIGMSTNPEVLATIAPADAVYEAANSNK